MTSQTNPLNQELDADFHKGKSTFTFPNGDKYQGGYCAHRSGVVWREGYGIYTTKDGQVYQGFWVDDKLDEEEQVEIRFPSGAAFYGKLLDSKYNGPALYVIEQNMNLLCELNQNKPVGDLLLIDINGGEWFGTAGETSAVLLPEHAFYEAIPIDIGKGKIKKVSPSKEKLKKVSKQEKPPTRPQEELVTDKIKKLELKIFAKTKKTVSDLKFEESEWYQKYLDFKKKFEEIMGKVETDGEYSLDPSEKEWYEKYLDFRMKYLEIVEHRKNKLKNLSDYKLFELYNSDEFRNSCPPIPVFYPTEEVTEEDNPKPELSKPVHSKMFKSHS
nr:uncharacterized protein LOC111508545 [Leptinotarsa decemlineata]